MSGHKLTWWRIATGNHFNLEIKVQGFFQLNAFWETLKPKTNSLAHVYYVFVIFKIKQKFNDVIVVDLAAYKSC